MYKIFIDGQVGTTGLQIHEQLSARDDIELLTIEDKDRKNPDIKRQMMDASDVVILCLPDTAAVEAVQLVSSSNTRFIDASTAHRTHPDWIYGLPELSRSHRSDISSARYVSNPGCYPTGFLLPIVPLVKHSLLNPASTISINALSGYTGGGRSMIKQYETRATEQPQQLWNIRPYALDLKHKHVPEMQHYAGLKRAPLFTPSVGHFAQGMLVNVGLFQKFFDQTTEVQQVYDLLSKTYADEPCVNLYGPNDESQLIDGFLEPQANNGTNRLDIFVFGHREQILLISRLDNLGKGAAGAAVQNLNLMLGMPELQGLSIHANERLETGKS